MVSHVPLHLLRLVMVKLASHIFRHLLTLSLTPFLHLLNLVLASPAFYIPLPLRGTPQPLLPVEGKPRLP